MFVVVVVWSNISSGGIRMAITRLRANRLDNPPRGPTDDDEAGDWADRGKRDPIHDRWIDFSLD